MTEKIFEIYPMIQDIEVKCLKKLWLGLLTLTYSWYFINVQDIGNQCTLMRKPKPILLKLLPQFFLYVYKTQFPISFTGSPGELCVQ